MPYVHLFFPENDLALAANLSNYTPPKMAMAMHLSGEPLPMWYGAPGDVFICRGINAHWLTTMRQAFALETDVWPHRCEGYTPRPWGWSMAVRREFRFAGFSDNQLPSDTDLLSIRQLSHRRTSAEVFKLCSPFLHDVPCTDKPIEAHSVDETISLVDKYGGDAVLKSPWSNAGRGLVFTRCYGKEALIERIADIISAYGSVMVERRYDRLIDFATLFEAFDDGTVRYCGLSLFEADRLGAYTRNIVARDDILISLINRYIDVSKLQLLIAAQEVALAKIINAQYTGLLGIDMFVAESAQGFLLNPCCELNLRTSMGHVAHSLAANILAPGLKATLAAVPNPYYNSPKVPDNPLQNAEVRNNRLQAGTLILNRTTSRFLFTLNVENEM